MEARSLFYNGAAAPSLFCQLLRSLNRRGGPQTPFQTYLSFHPTARSLFGARANQTFVSNIINHEKLSASSCPEGCRRISPQGGGGRYHQNPPPPVPPPLTRAGAGGALGVWVKWMTASGGSEDNRTLADSLLRRRPCIAIHEAVASRVRRRCAVLVGGGCWGLVDGGGEAQFLVQKMYRDLISSFYQVQ